MELNIINIAKIMVYNILNTNDTGLQYVGAFGIIYISFVLLCSICAIYLMIIELIEAIFESKTWHWILLGGKGRNSQNPIRLEKIKKRGLHYQIIKNVTDDLVLVKIVLKRELGRATSFIDVYAVP